MAERDGNRRDNEAGRGGGVDSRERLFGVLLDKVAEDMYPSNTMLDMIERLMEPEDVDAYAAVLMEKIADEQFPSMPLIRRLVTLTES